MKNVLTLTLFSLTALAFTSCCSLGGSPLSRSVTTTVTEVVDGEVVTKQVKVPREKVKCLTSYKPCNVGCGEANGDVLKRASGQGWNGNPSIGLVPTMKVLAK